MAARFSGSGRPYEGLANFVTIASSDPKDSREPRWTGNVLFVRERLRDPLRWTKPRMVFVNSMSDIFHEKLANEYIDQIFAVMAIAGRHTFQLLTKRAERMARYMMDPETPERILSQMRRLRAPDSDTTWPPKNLWVGVSVENQKTADRRIPFLLDTPASVRWVSYEPALGPVDFCHVALDEGSINAITGVRFADGIKEPLKCNSLDWVVFGGESGPHARPVDMAWARSALDQCRTGKTRFFMKQLGGTADKRGSIKDLPQDLRVREYPLNKAAVAASPRAIGTGPKTDG